MKSLVLLNINKLSASIINMLIALIKDVNMLLILIFFFLTAKSFAQISTECTSLTYTDNARCDIITDEEKQGFQSFDYNSDRIILTLPAFNFTSNTSINNRTCNLGRILLDNTTIVDCTNVDETSNDFKFCEELCSPSTNNQYLYDAKFTIVPFFLKAKAPNSIAAQNFFYDPNSGIDLDLEVYIDSDYIDDLTTSIGNFNVNKNNVNYKTTQNTADNKHVCTFNVTLKKEIISLNTVNCKITINGTTYDNITTVDDYQKTVNDSTIQNGITSTSNTSNNNTTTNSNDTTTATSNNNITTVTSKTGRIWMDRNLGATQVATSSTDEASYGDLYQWGRAADGHQLRTSQTTDVLSTTDQPGHGDFIVALTGPGSDIFVWRYPINETLWQGVDGINNPCPTGFRIPTQAEWQEEIASWDSSDAVGAFNSPLKLPMAGMRLPRLTNSFSGVSTQGAYWSSTVFSAPILGPNQTSFNSNSAFVAGGGSHATGSSVRCIKDISNNTTTPATTNDTTTPATINDTTTPATINDTTTPATTNDITTITSTTGRIWMDRNLGATQVATSSTDEASYGDLYQWGRAADGHQLRTSNTTTILSSTNKPGHSDFIITDDDWLSAPNNSLWSGIDGVNNPCPSGFRIPTGQEFIEEMSTWGANGAFESLKLPMAGYRDNKNGNLTDSSAVGFYARAWDDPSTVTSTKAPGISVVNGSASFMTYPRGYAVSIRCIKDITNNNIATVTSKTGRIWMDRNLGATQVATSSTDEASYGDLYQWGRPADGHQLRTSGITSVLSNTDQPGHGDFINCTSSNAMDWRNPQNEALWQGINGVNNPCPAGFRIPTQAEWNDELASWDSKDAAGAINSALKLPTAGTRRLDGSNDLFNSGEGSYWASDVNLDKTNLNPDYSTSMNLYSSQANISNNVTRGAGLSVRCIKE